MATQDRKLAQRISVSLPAKVASGLDQLVEDGGYPNRSRFLARLVEAEMIERGQTEPARVMAGTLTFFFDARQPGLLDDLARIQREHIAECISSHQILLEEGHIMEVVLVQGPVRRLREITDRLLSCKGVGSGKLTLNPRIIPPLHGRQG